jgi:hypothetical protein
MTDQRGIISLMENDIVLKYAIEYKEMMVRFNRYGRWTKSEDPLKNTIVGNQIKELVKVIKPEKYATRKLFVDEICDFLDEGSYGEGSKIDPVVFNKIIWPVFVTEYKNENAKYIRWIAQCHNLINRIKLKQLDALVAYGDGFEYFEYFCGKSFMIDKDQNTLDMLMHEEMVDIIVYRQDFDCWIRCPERYLELLKPFSDRFERCRKYCKISGNDKWNQMLADWELLVTHLYKYEEYVRNNAYVRFNEYLKEIGVRIIFDND